MILKGVHYLHLSSFDIRYHCTTCTNLFGFLRLESQECSEFWLGMKLLSRILKYSKKATSTTHRKQIRRALFFGRKDYFLATFAPKNLDTTQSEGQVFDCILIFFRSEITQIFTDIIDNPRTYKSILFHKLQKLAREGPDRHPTAFTP